MLTRQRLPNGVERGQALWDCPSFWAAGRSASRGVALLFKACPLLSEVSAYAADPCGRFIAAQGTLSGSHDTMASEYAPCGDCLP